MHQVIFKLKIESHHGDMVAFYNKEKIVLCINML